MASSRSSSALLISESPLQVLPTLAVTVGLNEAILLQQVHYWLSRSENERDGRKWVYNSYPDWKRDFPFWSEGQIRRTIESLENQGVLLSANYNAKPNDRTKWYSIDYGRLDELMNGAVSSVENDSSSAETDRSSVKFDRPTAENNRASAENDGPLPVDYDRDYNRDYDSTSNPLPPTRFEEGREISKRQSARGPRRVEPPPEAPEPFKRLWEIYPTWNGVKGSEGLALDEFTRYPPQDWEKMVSATEIYVRVCGPTGDYRRPKSAENFLHDETFWRGMLKINPADIQTGERANTNGQQTNGRLSAAEHNSEIRKQVLAARALQGGGEPDPGDLRRGQPETAAPGRTGGQSPGMAGGARASPVGAFRGGISASYR